MKLDFLYLGETCMDGTYLGPGIYDGLRVHIPVLAYLLETSSGERVLIDSGMHSCHVEDPEATFGGTPTSRIVTPVMRPEDRLADRLADIHVDPSSIGHVINTHLHFDHAGNNTLFPDAVFYVQSEQLDVARSAGEGSYSPQYWDGSGLEFERLTGDTEITEGVQVVVSSGHVPGHQSVLVTSGGTGYMFSGDAIFLRTLMEHDSWSGHADAAQARASCLRLREMSERANADLVFGHDPEQARELVARGPVTF